MQYLPYEKSDLWAVIAVVGAVKICVCWMSCAGSKHWEQELGLPSEIKKA